MKTLKNCWTMTTDLKRGKRLERVGNAVRIILLGGLLQLAGIGYAQSPFWMEEHKGDLPMVLLGPVYEAEIEPEQNQQAFAALESVLASLAAQRPSELPKSYAGLWPQTKRLRFVPGYRDDEEWGTIKTRVLSKGTIAPESLAAILSANENREVGVHMAFRIPPPSTTGGRWTLEGYRYFKRSESETGSAEWFSVALAQNNPAALRTELLWQMVRPPQKAVWDRKRVEAGPLKYWSRASMGTYQVPTGYLVPTTPVSPDFLRLSCTLGRCAGESTGDGKHVSRNGANQTCQSLGADLITEHQHLVLVEDGEISPTRKVWTTESSQVNTYSKELNHWKVTKTFTAEAEVWCTMATGQRPLNFREWPYNTIVQNLLSHTIYVYRASIRSKGEMVSLDEVLARTGETTDGVTTFQILGNWLFAAKLTTDKTVSINKKSVRYGMKWPAKISNVGINLKVKDTWNAIESFNKRFNTIGWEGSACIDSLRCPFVGGGLALPLGSLTSRYYKSNNYNKYITSKLDIKYGFYLEIGSFGFLSFFPGIIYETKLGWMYYSIKERSDYSNYSYNKTEKKYENVCTNQTSSKTLYSTSGECDMDVGLIYIDASGGYWLTDWLRVTSGIRKYLQSSKRTGGVFEFEINQNITVNIGATLMLDNVLR